MDEKMITTELPLFIRVIKFGYIINNKTSEIAAEYGCVEVLEWLAANKFFCLKNLCRAAARGAVERQLDNLKWAYEHGSHMNYFAYDHAVYNNNIEMMKWLWSVTHSVPDYICSMIATDGQLEMLKLVISYGAKVAEDVIIQAEMHDNLEIVEWLIRERFWHNPTITRIAAKKGHLKILKLLKEYGYELTAETFKGAAKSGNLEMLQWLYEWGCPKNSSEVYQTAKKYGHYGAVLNWLNNTGIY